MAEVYFGGFRDYDGMLSSWQQYSDESDPANSLTQPVPREENVLFASYGGESYTGDATVVFRHEGALYEVHGSHCSCYGLEDQWEPEETTIAALAGKGKKEHGRYSFFLDDHDAEAVDAYWRLVSKLQEDANYSTA